MTPDNDKNAPIRPVIRSASAQKGAPRPKRRERVRIPYWVLVRTQSGRENWCRQNIAKQEIKTFLPRIELPSGKLEPLFPTYLFVLIEDGRLPKRGTYGMITLVPSNERIERVPPRVMQSLFELVNDENYIENKTIRALTVGDTVSAKSGAFQFERGMYIGSRDGRCMVLVSLLGKDVELSVKRSDLQIVTE